MWYHCQGSAHFFNWNIHSGTWAQPHSTEIFNGLNPFLPGSKNGARGSHGGNDQGLEERKKNDKGEASGVSVPL